MTNRCCLCRLPVVALTFLSLWIGIGERAGANPTVVCSPKTPPSGSQVHYVEFDASGRLRSLLPTRVGKGDWFRFAVNLSPNAADNPIQATIELYLTALEGVAGTLNKKEVTAGNVASCACDAPMGATPDPPVWSKTAFGTSRQSLLDVRRSLCHEVRTQLTSGGLTLRDGEFYLARLESLGCPPPDPADMSTPLVPSLTTLAQVDYSLGLRCLSDSGALQSQQNPELGIPAEGVECQLEIPCSRIEFDLRRSNPVAAEIERRALSLGSSITNLRPCLKVMADCPADSNSPAAVVARWTDEVPKAEQSLESLLQGHPIAATPFDVDKALVQIDAASKTVSSRLLQLHRHALASGWINSWLWLSAGQPAMSPINAAPQKAKLEEARIKLTQAEAKIKTLELIATNSGFAVANLVQIDQDIAKIAEHRTERDRLAREVQRLEAEIQRTTEQVLKNNLLYQGLVLTSHGLEPAVMRHHDAQNKYKVIDAFQVEEVSEAERMFVLVENEKVETRLKLGVTITKITVDRSIATDEVLLSAAADVGAQVIAGRLTDDAQDLAQKLSEFLLQYAELRAMVQILERQTSLPSIPVRTPEDATPAFVSRIVPHDVAPAPADVAYTISVEKDGGTETQVGGGSYRLNKLYHLRFRTGLLYSHLRTTDFTIGDNGQVTEAIERHGADGTFGIQIYPRARDIRSNRHRWIPVFFLGLSMDEPTDNLFPGLGWEPWSGVSILGGYHLGRNEQLVRVDGVPSRVKENWDGDWFMSLAVDVDFFKRLFSLKDLL